jgi:hypothetical protein
MNGVISSDSERHRSASVIALLGCRFGTLLGRRNRKMIPDL